MRQELMLEGIVVAAIAVNAFVLHNAMLGECLSMALGIATVFLVWKWTQRRK